MSCIMQEIGSPAFESLKKSLAQREKKLSDRSKVQKNFRPGAGHLPKLKGQLFNQVLYLGVVEFCDVDFHAFHLEKKSSFWADIRKDRVGGRCKKEDGSRGIFLIAVWQDRPNDLKICRFGYFLPINRRNKNRHKKRKKWKTGKKESR